MQGGQEFATTVITRNAYPCTVIVQRRDGEADIEFDLLADRCDWWHADGDWVQVKLYDDTDAIYYEAAVPRDHVSAVEVIWRERDQQPPVTSGAALVSLPSVQ